MRSGYSGVDTHDLMDPQTGIPPDDETGLEIPAFGLPAFADHQIEFPIAPCPILLPEYSALQLQFPIVRQGIAGVWNLIVPKPDGGQLGFNGGWRQSTTCISAT